jgi:hypothetical protein
VSGAVAGADGAAAWGGSLVCAPRRLKNGFLVSVSGLVTGKLVWTAGEGTGGTATAVAGAGGESSFRSTSRLS